MLYNQSKPCIGCPVKKAFATGKKKQEEITTPDGRTLLVQCYPVNNKDGVVISTLNIMLEITNYKKIEEALKESEKKYRLIAENVTDVIFRQDMNLNIIYVSPSAAHLFGYSIKEAPKLKTKDFMTPDSFKRAIDSFQKEAALAKEKKNTDIPLMEYEYVRKDGSTFWGELKVTFLRDSKDCLVGVQGILRDISDRKKVEEKLKYMSFHDSLTGLYNRAYFEEELKRLDTKRQFPLSFIMGDVNSLKLINDAFGYIEGDLLLCKCSRILEECCRKEDIVARWGGDEFLILLPKTTEENVARLINRIIKKCRNESTKKIPLSISLGVSTKNNPDQDTSAIMKQAGDNMVNRKLLESRNISSSIIQSLERTLWEKSHETQDHAERLKKMALKLGKAINFPQNKLDELLLLSSLHDIGKIAIPDEILLKKDKLTKKEWRVMKRHSEIGYNIVGSSPQLAHIAYAILYHHEWWNGSGYPQGLKGKNIPAISRILAIVDAYDVMRTGRPYKERAVTKKEAIEELRKSSGTQFDPNLVKIFVKILNRR